MGFRKHDDFPHIRLIYLCESIQRLITDIC